ncbi:MAG: metal ABC transporter permease [Candidatus Hydrogenedentes bacterium]|nr:metal ABC transporter permease [Candidatus Hydrogenedentota bacterium]
MNDFLEALFDPEFPFLRNAILSGVLASISFGIVGSYVVTRRLTSLAGAISHSVLGGVGFVLFLSSKGLNPLGLTPLHGAILASIVSAIIIFIISKYIKGREDAVIGAVWACGMAIGMVFLAYTPGYKDPMSYLFGSMLLITNKELLNLSIVAVFVLGTSIVLFSQLWAICFDEEFASVRTLKVNFLYFLLLVTTALTVVMMIPMVGIVLVIAQLTLPVLIAERFFRRLPTLMAGSILVCSFTSTLGILFSYLLDLPPGSVIILLSLTAYLVVLLFKN